MTQAEGLMPVPEGLGLREAAALLHDGPTALGLFENATTKSNSRLGLVKSRTGRPG